MASSGWQEERTIHQNGGFWINGNVRINSITHSGNSYIVNLTTALGGRGNGSEYYQYGIQVAAGGETPQVCVPAGQSVYPVDASHPDRHNDFTVSYPDNISYSYVWVRYTACANNDCSETAWVHDELWHIGFEPQDILPSDITMTYNSSTWHSVDMTASISSWGMGKGDLRCLMITGDTNGQVQYLQPNSFGMSRHEWLKSNTSDLTFNVNGTQNNIYGDTGTPLEIKGLLCYKLAAWVTNSAGTTWSVENDVRYLPPAPPIISYQEPDGYFVAKTYQISFVGDTINNHSVYDNSYPTLNRTVRYKIDDGEWVNVVEHAAGSIDTVTSFSITLPYGSTAVVEGWMRYHAMESERTVIYITNINADPIFYGSVTDLSKKVQHLYGSVTQMTNTSILNTAPFVVFSIDANKFEKKANNELLKFVSKGFAIDYVHIINVGSSYGASIRISKDGGHATYSIMVNGDIDALYAAMLPWGIEVADIDFPAGFSSVILPVSAEYIPATKKISKLYGPVSGLTKLGFRDV